MRGLTTKLFVCRGPCAPMTVPMYFRNNWAALSAKARIVLLWVPGRVRDKRSFLRLTQVNSNLFLNYVNKTALYSTKVRPSMKVFLSWFLLFSSGYEEMLGLSGARPINSLPLLLAHYHCNTNMWTAQCIKEATHCPIPSKHWSSQQPLSTSNFRFSAAGTHYLPPILPPSLILVTLYFKTTKPSFWPQNHYLLQGNSAFLSNGLWKFRLPCIYYSGCVHQ